MIHEHVFVALEIERNRLADADSIEVESTDAIDAQTR